MTRLIDADALRSITSIQKGDFNSIETIQRWIDEAPTVERPHGEWFGTVCTNCGESTSFYYDCNYCPQCGADMGIKGGEAE